MEKKDKKRLIIISIYTTIFILILIPIIFSLMPKDSCSDGKQNQDEKGVDCGGVCSRACEIKASQDMVFSNTGLVETNASNKFDVYSEIMNPNKDYGSSSFDYIFYLKDASNTVLAKKEGKSFIFPGDKKYIIELGIISDVYPAKVEFEIKNIVWNDFADVQKPQLVIINKNFNEVSSNSGSSDAIGLLRNESPFDFNEINIQVVVKNENGKVAGLNSTKINTVQSGESREFKVLWPNKIYSVGNMEVQAEANVFKSDAFVKRYFPGQMF